jgi:hypothetical protein
VDLSALRAQVLALNFTAHGVDATVTPVGLDEIPDIRAIWLTDETTEQPAAAIAGRRQALKGMAFRKADVPSLPRGSRILAPLPTGGDPIEWVVDSLERSEADHWRVLVVIASGS